MSLALVTGGAGFIGSHLAAALLAHGWQVRVLDHLEPPTHPPGRLPALDPRIQLVVSPVGDAAALERALDGVDVVFHLAATGGYRPGYQRYLELNSLHTAVLLDCLARRPARIRRLIVASSVAVYGEGAYQCPEHGRQHPGLRSAAQLEAGRWELECPRCGQQLSAAASGESDPVDPARPYSLSKYDQERLVLMAGAELRLEVAALRYFVTYGPGQALSNPYTGVLCLFANRVRNGLPPLVYEDGLQSRDMIHVSDLVAAHLCVLDAAELPHRLYNVGTGAAVTMRRLAQLVARGLGSELEPSCPGRYRLGDVRHIVADTTRIRQLGFEPHYDIELGVEHTLGWLRQQELAPDRLEQAEREARAAGLLGERAEP